MSEKTTSTTTTANDAVSRRDVLKTAAAGAGLIMALPVLATAARADSPAPPPPTAAEVWKAIGDAKDFVKGQPKRVDLGGPVAWVTRLDHAKVEAVLASCTHRGCELGWDNQSAHLVCPCHGGTFNADGSCVYGTRRNPSELLPHLQTLPTRVTKGMVEVNVGGLA
jgi:nitrite reductase/ring-hydroxylating ferredoxin subunit